MKIAIISASTPANGNTGMISVEFGALVLEKHFPEAELTWITFPAKPGSPDNSFTKSVKDRIVFEHLPEALETLGKYDVIIYWGDFLNSRAFVRFSALNQAKAAKISLSEEKMETMLFKAFLLEGYPDNLLSRVILFGGTILSNAQKDFDDERYQKALSRLVKKAAGVYMRDPISAARIQAMREDEEACLGIDPALLQKNNPPGGLAERDSRRVGLFVGARTMVPEFLPDFVRHLEKKSGIEIVWVPWLPDRRRLPVFSLSRYIKDSLKIFYPSNKVREKVKKDLHYRDSVRRAKTLAEKYKKWEAASYHDLLRLVSSCGGGVITDTYHLILNAWRMEVPVLCIGNAEPQPGSYGQGTLADIKKLIYHFQFQADECYCTTSFFEQDGAFARLEAIMCNGKNHHFNEVGKLTDKVEKKLVSRIRSIIAEKATGST